MRQSLLGLLVFSFCLLGSGCAGLQSFRVVDAQSGLPVAGIEAERLSGSVRASPVPFLLMNMLSPVERKPSDSSGAVAFETSGKHFAVNPRSTAAGYGRAYVTATWSGATINYPDEHRQVEVRPINGMIEVPLRRFISVALPTPPATTSPP